MSAPEMIWYWRGQFFFDLIGPKKEDAIKYIPEKLASPQVESAKYTCSECGAEMNQGERNTFTVCDKCWNKAYQKEQVESSDVDEAAEKWYVNNGPDGVENLHWDFIACFKAGHAAGSKRAKLGHE